MLTLFVFLGYLYASMFANEQHQLSNCEHIPLYLNKRTSMGRFTYFENTGIKICGKECFLRAECLSISYDKIRKKCILQSYDMISGGVIVSAENFVYIEMSDWHLVSIIIIIDRPFFANAPFHLFSHFTHLNWLYITNYSGNRVKRYHLMLY